LLRHVFEPENQRQIMLDLLSNGNVDWRPDFVWKDWLMVCAEI
jgi:hypothetical protein